MKGLRSTFLGFLRCIMVHHTPWSSLHHQFYSGSRCPSSSLDSSTKREAVKTQACRIRNSTKQCDGMLSDSRMFLKIKSMFWILLQTSFTCLYRFWILLNMFFSPDASWGLLWCLISSWNGQGSKGSTAQLWEPNSRNAKMHRSFEWRSCILLRPRREDFEAKSMKPQDA